MEIEKEQLGRRSLEYTVSGIHTKMYPGSLDRAPNKRRIGGFDGEPNYAIFEISSEGKKVNIRFSGHSLAGEKMSRIDHL